MTGHSDFACPEKQCLTVSKKPVSVQFYFGLSKTSKFFNLYNKKLFFSVDRDK